MRRLRDAPCLTHGHAAAWGSTSGFLASGLMVFQALSHTQWTPAERRARWGGGMVRGGVSYFEQGGWLRQERRRVCQMKGSLPAGCGETWVV